MKADDYKDFKKKALKNPELNKENDVLEEEFAQAEESVLPSLEEINSRHGRVLRKLGK